MSGVPYHAWTHRPKAQGGTDPIEMAGVSYAYISWIGADAVTVNTLVEPSSLRDYDEGFSISNVDLDNEVYLTSGDVRTGDGSGWFLASGWAQFNGGATVGSQLGVALDFGNGGSYSTYRVGNSIIANSINEVFRIPVQKTWLRYNDFGHDSVRLLVWHDDAGGQDLASCFLSITHLTTSTNGTFVF